jgi:hypothetical protein
MLLEESSRRDSANSWSIRPPHEQYFYLLIITYGFRPYFKVPCGVLIESF